jgi:hypothetical protein
MDETTQVIHSLPAYIRVTGSYARGEQTPNSDIDFYVPERRWEHFKKWAEQNMKGTPTSPIMGALTWREPMMLEFSDLFDNQNLVVKERTVFGRTFKTW